MSGSFAHHKSRTAFEVVKALNPTFCWAGYAHHPRILQIGEPFDALGHQTRGLMQALLHGRWETERKTVLFVTHDIGEAIFMGHRVVMMSAWPCRIECDMPMAIAHLYHCSAKTTAMFMELKAHLTEEIRVEMRQAKALLATDS